MKNISEILDGTIICLNCGNTLLYSGLDKHYGYFYCEQCSNIHLNNENIWIFLPDSHEDYRLFNAFFMTHRDRLDAKHVPYFEQKANCIRNNTNRTWEDEDTKHWDESYSQAQQGQDEETKLDTSTYSRDLHLIKYVRDDNFHHKVLCEIGAGSAATIRKLISPLKYPYYYIPTDYSYEALKLLQKSFGLQNNIQYIQCLGNRLPFRDNSIDYIFSLGVLHHMPQKETHVDEIMPKLKPKGLFLFYEGYERGTRLSTLFFKYGKYLVEPKQSAHEERINRAALEKIMAKYNVIHYKHEYSPFLTLSMAFYNKLKMNNLPLLRTILFADQLVINSIGMVFKTFSSGACFAVLQKK